MKNSPDHKVKILEYTAQQFGSGDITIPHPFDEVGTLEGGYGNMVFDFDINEGDKLELFKSPNGLIFKIERGQ